MGGMTRLGGSTFRHRPFGPTASVLPYVRPGFVPRSFVRRDLRVPPPTSGDRFRDFMDAPIRVRLDKVVSGWRLSGTAPHSETFAFLVDEAVTIGVHMFRELMHDPTGAWFIGSPRYAATFVRTPISRR
jgi:hypothetical protein